MTSGIYKILNKIDGKFYIGSSKNIEGRWSDHIRNLRSNSHVNPKLQHAWNFHGENNFEFLIVESTDDVLDREQYFLDELKPYIRGIGYNICETSSGGDNLKNHPNGEQIKKEWSKKYKEMYSGKGNPMFGKQHTENSIKIQKEKSKGRFTLEWFIEKNGVEVGTQKFDDRKTKLKDRSIRYSYDNKLTGTKRGPMSEENKKKISDARKKLKDIRHLLHRDIENGKMTLIQIEKMYGVSKTTILREKRKLKSKDIT